LASTEVADRTIVQSFDVETVRLLRELAPSVTSGLLVRAADEDAIALCRQLGVQVCNPSVRSVLEAPRSVAAIHDSGLRTFPWTANESADWEGLREAGVDGIITDRPDRLRGWLDAHSS